MATTQPLNVSEIAAIRDVLKTARDRCLFAFGCNTAFRGGDILQLNVGHVKNIKAGDTLTLTEEKTGKRRTVLVNAAVHAALQELLATMSDDPNQPLFQPAKHPGERLTIQSLSRMWKDWSVKANIEKNVASHSGRKTAARHWHEKGVPLARIMVALNHTSEATTARYLGIVQDDLNAMYSHCI